MVCKLVSLESFSVVYAFYYLNSHPLSLKGRGSERGRGRGRGEEGGSSDKAVLVCFWLLVVFDVAIVVVV